MFALPEKLVEAVIYPLVWRYVMRSRHREYFLADRATWEAGNEAYARRGNALLHEVLDFALASIPRYRDDPKAEREWRALGGESAAERLRRFPIVTKKTIREEGRRLAADPLPGDAFKNTSGGSTGVPVEFLQDQREKDHSLAAKLMAFHLAGVHVGQRGVAIWGAPQDTTTRGKALRWVAKKYLVNERLLNSFLVGPEEWKSWVSVFERFRPVWVEAYADSIYEFACWLEAQGRRLPPPRAVVTSANQLTPEMRAAVERVFGVVVTDRYGSREVGTVAATCPEERRFHVFNTNAHVEIVDEEGAPCAPGEEGELLITSPHNRAMPLVRFAIGDRAVASTVERCPCGRPGQLFEALAGRASYHIVASDGRKIAGTAATLFFYHVPHLLRYQLHQSESGALAIRAVPTPEDAGEELRRNLEPMREQFQRKLKDFPVTIEIVPRLDVTASGKHLYVTSDFKGRA